MPTALCGFDDSPGSSGGEALVQHGPTLLVRIGFDEAYDIAKPRVLARLPSVDHFALVDTGASDCCIDSGLALTLNLPIVDQRVCAGISGARLVNMHLAQIFAPALAFTFVGAFAGVDLAAGGQSHLALIGRSFLRLFKMSYDGVTGAVAIEGPA